MFDIGWTELLVVAVVALIVIGPRELPAMLRTIGNGLSKIRRMAGEFQSQFNEALREAELDDLRRQAEKLSGEMSKATAFDDPLAKATSELQRAIEAPAPPAEPAPENAAKDEPPVAAPAESAGGGRGA
jgi:sec-independent protein translocase protein TatB